MRGIKDSRSHLHAGWLLTLEDAGVFFNLLMEVKLNEQEKKDIVAFMRVL